MWSCEKSIHAPYVKHLQYMWQKWKIKKKFWQLKIHALLRPYIQQKSVYPVYSYYLSSEVHAIIKNYFTKRFKKCFYDICSQTSALQVPQCALIWFDKHGLFWHRFQMPLKTVHFGPLWAHYTVHSPYVPQLDHFMSKESKTKQQKWVVEPKKNYPSTTSKGKHEAIAIWQHFPVFLTATIFLVVSWIFRNVGSFWMIFKFCSFWYDKFEVALHVITELWSIC